MVGLVELKNNLNSQNLCHRKEKDMDIGNALCLRETATTIILAEIAQIFSVKTGIWLSFDGQLLPVQPTHQND